MNNFVSIIIYTLPGILTYFMVHQFGVTPTTKFKGTELVAISAILLMPIFILTISIYDSIVYLTNFSKPIYTFQDLNEISGSFMFLLYYLIVSIILSFFWARFIVKFGYKFYLEKTVNPFREKLDKSPLTELGTIWDEIFVNNDSKMAIVQITKVDKKDDFIVGEIEYFSGPFDQEKNLILTNTDYWEKVIKDFPINVERAFVDVKTGMVIKIFENHSVIESRDLYEKKIEREIIQEDRMKY